MLDEPSAGLAPVIVAEVLATVSRLRASGLAIVLVEQLADQALSVADDVVVLEHGRVAANTVAADGDVGALREIYFGRDRGAQPTPARG
ncbi:hypothetical protein I6A84_42580 [Frankia sp. CNm7]|uniref:Branched-chain amino acid ATP-binding cassette transporter C-terminal domain-containing protein n=1 Tax=Frankia nepalensis TaxID=1836974 RepID=A0A937ULM0_9ACTN|nr:hypothetical protein [Frankia nepalensis]MBL7496895.1 hypothetical protein [Frankia nepalensis]MBL7508344.1 hypothetical protein [Frankia nepalensis]MBL7524552.1 hypothetical protein [Frankia nepalensis]MBL7626173.1 hypothetical protein [Frankia nepalensis]